MLRCVLKRNHPLAGQVALLCGLCRGGDLGVAHAVEQLHVIDDQCAGFRRGEQAVLEFSRELRLLLIQLTKLRLVCLGEIGAGADEIPVVQLDERFLLLVQTQLVASVIYAFHPLIQLAVQEDRIGMRCDFGCDSRLDRLKRVGCMRTRQSIEDFRGPGEECTGFLELDNRVVECRSCSRVGDDVDLSELLRHSGRIGGLIVRLANLREIGRLIWKCALHRERVARGERGRCRWSGRDTSSRLLHARGARSQNTRQSRNEFQGSHLVGLPYGFSCGRGINSFSRPVR